MVSGVDALFLTKLDILTRSKEIKICTGYELDGEEAHYYDLDSYQLVGRNLSTRQCAPAQRHPCIRQFGILPREAQRMGR